ncbi:MAG: hypothetical protein JXR79_00950 [Nitrospirae bacterium]|nr:hypothetical protein [Nitrospirota bacterium]
MASVFVMFFLNFSYAAMGCPNIVECWSGACEIRLVGIFENIKTCSGKSGLCRPWYCKEGEHIKTNDAYWVKKCNERFSDCQGICDVNYPFWSPDKR